MAKLFEIEPGDGSVVDDPAAADDEMTQTCGATGPSSGSCRPK
jgi:hypothetical protein